MRSISSDVRAYANQSTAPISQPTTSCAACPISHLSILRWATSPPFPAVTVPSRSTPHACATFGSASPPRSRYSIPYLKAKATRTTKDDEGPLSALKRLARLNDLPAQLKSIQFEGATLHHRTRPPTLNKAFPLRSLTSIEIVHTDRFSTFAAWIVNASAGELKRLKLWGNPYLKKKDMVDMLERVGPKLDEFLFKPADPDPTALPQLLQCVPPLRRCLKVLFRSPQVLQESQEAYDRTWRLLPQYLFGLHHPFPPPPLRQHPQQRHRSDSLQELLTTGPLRTVRRLELYSHIYFPPPLDITYLDDIPGPATQLRELRLSHIIARPIHLLNLVTAVGPGLRTLAVHHVAEKLAKLVKLCPNLLRLEIGVALEPASAAKKDFFKSLVAPRLHLLRIHFQSGIELGAVVGAVKGGRLVFPTQVCLFFYRIQGFELMVILGRSSGDGRGA